MDTLTATAIKNLIFPNAHVEKMRFIPENKILKFYMSSAWLKEDDGYPLGNGILTISNWESLRISKFNGYTQTFVEPEFLAEICEVQLSDSLTKLCGFGKESDQWIEWEIINSKIHAEFEFLHDAYPDRTALRNLVLKNAISLRKYCLNDLVWTKENAIKLINDVMDKKIGILGGDVYKIWPNRADALGENWNSEPRNGESKEAFWLRSKQHSISYIQNYPLDPNEPIFFSITFS